MQGYTFATCHWLLYPVFFVSCHSCRQNRVCHIHTHTHTEVQDYVKAHWGAPCLQKHSVPDHWQCNWGKWGVNRRHIVRFGL